MTGITSCIEAVHILPATGSYKVVDKSNPYDGIHEVLAVDANDGKSYIIDLSGAQIGLKIPVVPLNDYMKMFGARIVDIYKHDCVLTQLSLAMKRGFPNPRHAQMYATHYHMYQALNRVVETSEKNMGLSLSELTQRNNNTYAGGKLYLEHQIRVALREAFASREEWGHPCIFASPENLYLDPEELEETLDDLELDLLDDEAGSGICQQFVRQSNSVEVHEPEQGLHSGSTDPWKFNCISRPVITVARSTQRKDLPWLSLLVGMFRRP